MAVVCRAVKVEPDDVGSEYLFDSGEAFFRVGVGKEVNVALYKRDHGLFSFMASNGDVD
jgi:hypothetical protein